jgi:hypothetical protein
VKVARDPQPLLGHGHSRELFAGLAQLAVRPDDPPEGGHQDADRDDRQHGRAYGAPSVSTQPAGEADTERGQQRQRHRYARRQPQAGRRHEVDEQGGERGRRAGQQQHTRHHGQERERGQLGPRPQPREPTGRRQQGDVERHEHAEAQ